MRKTFWSLSALLLLAALPLHARHVRAYCFLSADSMSVCEDSCVRLSVEFDEREGHVVVNIYNKTDSTLYLRGYGSTATAGGRTTPLVELERNAACPLAPRSVKRLHGWNMLVQKLDSEVVDQGRCREAFQWAPGHKGHFIDADGHRRRFRKGAHVGYSQQTSPLSLSARVTYATSKAMDRLCTAEACLYVSDIIIGRRRGGLAADASVPADFRRRPHFHFDSGGCDALPYAGSVTLMSAGYAVAGVFILGAMVLVSKLDSEDD